MGITVMEYELPPAGLHRAVCAEVGIYNVKRKNFDTGQNEMVDQVIFSFEIEAMMKNGKRFVITRGAEFYPNASPTNGFGKFLASWSGSGNKLTKEQLLQWADAIDSKKIVGSNAQILIVHKTAKSTGNDTAVIDKIMPAAQGAERLTISAGYTAFTERQKAYDRNSGSAQSSPNPTPAAQPKAEDDVVPF